MPQNTKLLPASYLQKQQEVVDKTKQMEIEFEYRYPLSLIADAANAQIALNNNKVVGMVLNNTDYNALFKYLTVSLGLTITNIVPQQQQTTFDINW